MSDAEKSEALVKVETLSLELETAKTTIKQLDNALRLAKQDVTHLQGLNNNMWNERAAMLRRNSPPPPPGTQAHEEIMGEKRLVSACFKIAHRIPFEVNCGPDDAAEFHLAMRNLIQVRTGTSVPLYDVDKSATEQASGTVSYESMLETDLTEPRMK